MLSILALALTLAAGAPPASKVPDQIRLNSGRTLQGRVLSETGDELRIRVGRGEVEVARKDVAEVRSIERSLAEFIHRWDEMPKNDLPALSDLARFCESRGLPGEARVLWLRVLRVDVSSEEAARALGARKVADNWQIDTGRTWLRLADYLSAKSRWRDAIEIPTAHFLVRTDLALERVLDATIQLERHYLRFYEFLGPELDLYLFNEVPEINIYGEARNYPAPPQMGDPSWFQLGINQLHVLAHDPLDLHGIQRDVTEMLLYNALRQSSGHNGEIQAWAQRGLSEYFAATSGERVGDPWAPLGTVRQPAFVEQESDKKPLSLDKLLTTAHSEFRAGPDGERRSIYAYTFMHYLMEGDGRSHRANFFQYLRDGWLGAGGKKLVFKDLDVTEKDLEKRWKDYVRDVALGR